ncbi:MAG TPA: nuclear transport factor 2 family protein, partial [Actinomycetota bacterium]
DVAEGWFKAVGNADRAAVVGYVTPDTEFSVPGAPSLRGVEAIAAFVDGYLTAFPGAGFTMDNVWEHGNTAIVEGTYIGTHTGVMRTPDGQEIPPTGKSVTLPFVAIFDADGATIRSNRVYWDNMGFMAQLGLMPS